MREPVPVEFVERAHGLVSARSQWKYEDERVQGYFPHWLIVYYIETEERP
jgi:hypothetical protein